MLGQIVYSTQGRGRLRLEEVSLCGLPVLQVKVDPEGRWGRHRLKKVGKLLARSGTRRVLVPEGFAQWELLERYALRRVDPMPFLRAHAADLAVAALRRQGDQPEQCAVALRAVRTDRDVVRAAQELCTQVRDVCISVPKGGGQLSDRLRWEFGVAVRPDFGCVPAAVRFDSRTWDRANTVVDLFPPGPDSEHTWVRLKGLDGVETEHFPLLAALWEGGKVQRSDLEFT